MANWSIESVVINTKEDCKNNVIKNLLSNQKGMALLTTLIFVFILITFGVSLLIMTSNDTKLSTLQRDSTKAFYIAEAGVERTLYNLKKDFESSEDWNDGDINGYSLTDEDANGFQKIEYDGEDDYDVSFGDGTYTVALKINSSDYVTIKSKGKYDNSIRYVQVDAKIEKLSIWGNGIFGGSGASDSVISGKVDIRGSVHILGEGLSSDDTAIEIIGAAGIGNNYKGIEDVIYRIATLPTTTFNDEQIDTIRAKLRVQHGKVKISSNAVTIGDPDEPGNVYKETLDGVYVTDGFEGFVANIYSDNGKDQPYDLGEGTFEFPDLMADDYIDAINGGTVNNPNTGNPYTYDGYYNSDNTLKITDISSISSDTESFHYPNPEGEYTGPDENGNSIRWDQENQKLKISGIIVIDVDDIDFAIGNISDSIEYEGTGTMVSKGDISISGNLLPETLFPESDALGLIAYENLKIFGGTTTNPRQVKMGVFYAQKEIRCDKQNRIIGTFVSDYIDMGNQVPSIYQVPELINNMPPGMPGATITYFIYTNNWHEVHQ
ncbi:hypothetical protein ES705_14849 [subsurface metagenome]